MFKYCGKGEKLLLRSNFSSYPQYFVTTRIRFSLRDKRLFEITEVKIMRVDCMYILWVEAEAPLQEHFSHIKAIIKQRWVKTDMLREKASDVP